MTFAALSPLALSLLMAAVLAAVVALYLLRPTPREITVSNVEFWRRAMERSTARFLAAQRVPIVPLVVSMVAAGLLVIDLADPRPAAGHPGLTVVVLSAGQSMAARTLAGPTRLEMARQHVMQAALRETARGEVALVRAGAHPEVLVARTGSPDDVARALDGRTHDDAPPDLAAALTLASRIARGAEGPSRVALVTDLPAHEVPMDTGVRPQLFPVGDRAETVAITSFGARRDGASLGEYAVLSELSAFSTRAARMRLVVRDRDTVISDEAVTLAPGERRWFSAQGFSSARAELTATLEGLSLDGARDALSDDDRAYGVVEPLARLRVLLVTEGDRFLDRALSLNPAVRLTTVRPSEASTVALEPFEVVVLDGVATPRLAQHPGVLMLAPPENSAVAVGPTLRAPSLTGVAVEHRVLDRVRMDDVQVREARTLVTGPEDTILLRGDRQALMLARATQGRRLVALGFDTRTSDLGERMAFPVWMHNVVLWLAREESHWSAARRPGEPWSVGAERPVLGPDRRPRPTHAGVLEDTTRAGLYRAGTHVAAYCDTDDRRALPTPEVVTATRDRLPNAAVPWRTWAAVLAVAWICLEWLLIHRGWLR